MKRTLIALGGLGIAVTTILMLCARDSAATSPPARVPQRVAAAGVVEPISEEIRIGAQLPGRLIDVRVEEGDRIEKGQILAALDRADYAARVAAAEASLRRLVNGARDEERRRARAAVKELEAMVASAQAESKRRGELVQIGAIGREEAERFEREYVVAVARLEAARESLALVEAPAREEDVAAAQAVLDEARATLEKTFVRSPINGIVIRRQARTGESVASAQTLFVVADRSVIRVRADIDEVDVARVHAGQRAWVTADAFGSRRFPGRVVRVGLSLGKRSVHTEDPREKADAKVLETLIELENGAELPLNLRVDAFVEVEEMK